MKNKTRDIVQVASVEPVDTGVSAFMTLAMLLGIILVFLTLFSTTMWMNRPPSL